MKFSDFVRKKRNSFFKRKSGISAKRRCGNPKLYQILSLEMRSKYECYLNTQDQNNVMFSLKTPPQIFAGLPENNFQSRGSEHQKVAQTLEVPLKTV